MKKCEVEGCGREAVTHVTKREIKRALAAEYKRLVLELKDEGPGVSAATYRRIGAVRSLLFAIRLANRLRE